MMDVFDILFMVFVLGAVFGGVLGSVFCSCSRLEENDATEHGNSPL